MARKDAILRQFGHLKMGTLVRNSLYLSKTAMSGNIDSSLRSWLPASITIGTGLGVQLH